MKEKNNEEKLEENYRFRTYLKCQANEKTLDKQFKKIHNNTLKTFDCSKSQNCLKF